MTAPEFSRPVRIDTLGGEPRTVQLCADEAERSALAKRFGLAALSRLTGEASLVRLGAEVAAKGRIVADVVQSCVVTGGPVEAHVDEPFDLVFRPHPEIGGPEEEVELGEGELDVIFYDGVSVDLGEAAAETLALALDPYPRAPGAEAALKEAGVKSEAEAGPFGALAALRDKMRE